MPPTTTATSDTAENPEDDGAGSQHESESPPPSPSKSKAPPSLRTGYMKSKKTVEGYDVGILYINKWMAAEEYPAFDDLTEQDVEQDHLQNFLENIYFWLANTNFKTKSGWLEKGSKVKYFSYIKNVFKLKFPNRDIWAKEDYWKATLKDFKASCDRSRTLDPVVEDDRKSAPLYRDLSGARCTAVRAKYLNNKVDARGVAMGMLKEGSAHTIQKASEFAISRQATG
jgi:hypothetical protein